MLKKGKMEITSCCNSCLAPLKDDDFKQLNPDHFIRYSCSECFFVSTPCLERAVGIHLPTMEDDCSVCLEKADKYDIFTCGHTLCNPCFKNMKLVKGTDELSCPKCREVSKIRFMPFCTKKPRFELPDSVRQSMRVLYLRLFMTAIKGIDNEYSISYRKRFKTCIKIHDELIEKFSQYYLWLTILAKSKTGAEKLLPGPFIEKVWTMHILDTVDYRNVCNTIAGKFIEHYTYDDTHHRDVTRFDNRIRLLKKLEKLKVNEKMLVNAWGYSTEIGKEFPRGGYIFIRQLTGKVSIFEIDNNTTTTDLHKFANCLNGGWGYRICFSGKMIEEGHLLSDIGIKHLSSVYYVLKL